MTTMNPLLDPCPRANYRWSMPLTTRWMDNDIYGHINNVIYYAYFDTVANAYLINACSIDIHNGDEIGYIVHSQCHYKSSLAYPDRLVGALRVNRIGNSSVEYGIAIFKADSSTAAAHGTFTHVFVDRASERPRPLSDSLRAGLTKILVGDTV
jgi:acyl-CoA thioester hydrolase